MWNDLLDKKKNKWITPTALVIKLGWNFNLLFFTLKWVNLVEMWYWSRYKANIILHFEGTFLADGILEDNMILLSQLRSILKRSSREIFFKQLLLDPLAISLRAISNCIYFSQSSIRLQIRASEHLLNSHLFTTFPYLFFLKECISYVISVH